MGIDSHANVSHTFRKQNALRVFIKHTMLRHNFQALTLTTLYMLVFIFRRVLLYQIRE